MKQGIDPVRPKNRTSHCMTSAREFLIVYGGFSEWCNEEHYGLWIYCTVSGVWRRYQTPIDSANASYESSICAGGMYIYIFGGVCFRDNSRQTNSLLSFDIANGTWKTIFPHSDVCDENTPPPMCGNLLFYHNEDLYVIGGLQGYRHVDTIYKFCLRTFTWSLIKQNEPKPPYNGRIFGTLFKNRFYRFGGSFITRPHGFRDVWTFDFSTNTWTARVTKSETQQFPGDRSEESFAFSSNFGYLSGGINQGTSTLYSDIWKFDLETLEWLKLDHVYEF
ncbi:Kelch domain-containing protein 10 [Thelohanellus kitauei]|uniref:Kelch domain-containing protein 10 n=1 Tax=Thelohanellus kitauei TaxID=669202 RepID=A0A0C2MQU5_THEKT|nr:Kelch domain-containing protein 10 [Thelohanellus kitauei]